MKSKILLILFYLATLISYVVAQTPGFNYQAVLRDVEGDVMPNVEITLLVTLIEGSGDDVLYSEKHELSSNELGILSTIIGAGEVEAGDFANIVGIQDLQIQLRAEIPGEANVVDIGRSEVGAVPLALYGRDEDSDPNNEMQSLSLEGDSLKVSGTPGISLAQFKSPWQRIEDGFALDLKGNKRNGEVTTLQITSEAGLAVSSESKTNLLHYCGSELSDGTNLRSITSGLIGDLMTSDEISMMASYADKSEELISASIGKVDRVGNYVSVEALSNDLDGFSLRGLGSFYRATGQFGDKCFDKCFYDDQLLSGNFFDGEMHNHGLNFNDGNGEFGGGLFARPGATLAAFSDLAALNGQNFSSLISTNTAGGDIITFNPEGQQATRATSLTDLGGIILLYDNQGNEKIRIACDETGSPGIWFGTERVVGSSSQIQANKMSDAGTLQLVDGAATVCSAPFKTYADQKKVTVQLTPLSAESKGLAVVEKFEGGFKVKELGNGKGNYQVDWIARSEVVKDVFARHLPDVPPINQEALQSMVHMSKSNK